MALRAVRPPEFLAGGRFVANDHLGARRHELVVIANPHDNRRRPAPARRAIRFPDLRAGLLVQRDDGRPGPHFLVALKNDEVLVKNRRRARAQTGLDDVADGFFPLELAGEVIGVDPE